MKIRKSLAKRSEANKPLWERGANPEQIEVIRHVEGPCRVLSAAGSGKTFALIRRIARLVEEYEVEGRRICAVTFAKKAGDEMTKRLKELGIRKCKVGTWHSLALQILRDDYTPYADWAIEDSVKGTNTRMVLKDVVGFKGMKWDSADLNAIASFIGVCKANLWAPSAEETVALSKEKFNWGWQRPIEAFAKYNDELERRQILSFDDFLVFAAKHLEDEVNRKRWASKFDFLLCDEVQDNNGAQEYLTFRLAGEHKNYMGVGDVFQSIYGFRGSTPRFLATFEERWPGAKTIVLPRNYRSGKKIIEIANKVVEKGRVPGIDPMVMIAERKDSGDVRVIASDSFDDEGKEVVRLISDSIESGASTPDEHTVLYRTNAQSRAIEEALLAKRIPYVVVGGVSFYERKEVRDLLSYLRLVANRAKVEDIRRSINTPFRFLGNAFVERIMSEVDEESVDHADWPTIVEYVANSTSVDGRRTQDRQLQSAMDWARLIRDVQATVSKSTDTVATEDQKRAGRPASLLRHIVQETRYVEFLNREEGSESPENSAAANVHEMVRVAERFDHAWQLLDYIDKTVKEARRQRKDKGAGGNRVLMMSFHRSKGLEWPFVYVVGMNEMLLPHTRGDFEEERRLAYVAVTRARDTLVMSYVRRMASKMGMKEVSPSPFLLDTRLVTIEPPSTELVGADKVVPQILKELGLVDSKGLSGGSEGTST